MLWFPKVAHSVYSALLLLADMDFLIDLTDIAIPLLILLAFIYYFIWLHRRNDYFRSKPIPSLPGSLFFGGTKPLMMSKVSFPEYVKCIYDKFPDAK